MDIRSATLANLSNVAFNAASKRHRPALKVGQAVICHVVLSDKNLETELSCEDPTSQRDWVTNEVYFGGLTEGGMFVDVSLSLAARLLSKSSTPLFNILAQHLKPFELAVGFNGRVYIQTNGDNLRTILLGQVLQKCEFMKLLEVEILCQEFQRQLGTHS